MIFFPYRAELPVYRPPIFTILICLICIGVFVHQARNADQVFTSTFEFCKESSSRSFKLTLKKSLDSISDEACAWILYQIHSAKVPQEAIVDIAKHAKPLASLSAAQSRQFLETTLSREYNEYTLRVPDNLTTDLWYRPDTWDPFTMLTSVFAHASWGHLIGNLAFFIAFSVALECLIGYVFYPIVFVALAVGTNLSYSLYSMVQESVTPTIGLSGVVMGIVAMLVFFIPRIRIRWFVWLIFAVWRPAIPAWLIAIFYIGFDTYSLLSLDQLGTVNLVAHVSGGVLGYLLGYILFWKKREELLDELEFNGSYQSNNPHRARRRRNSHIRRTRQRRR